MPQGTTPNRQRLRPPLRVFEVKRGDDWPYSRATDAPSANIPQRLASRIIGRLSRSSSEVGKCSPTFGFQSPRRPTCCPMSHFCASSIVLCNIYLSLSPHFCFFNGWDGPDGRQEGPGELDDGSSEGDFRFPVERDFEGAMFRICDLSFAST